jgi:hypothetical protein
MAVLVHNRRQTDLLVVCLLPVVTGEVVRMMDCGAGSQVNNPCPVGFRVPTRRVERRILQIQLLPLRNSN